MSEQEKDYIKELSDNMVNVRLDIRELMTEVRSLKDLKNTVVDHETRIVKAMDAAQAANLRLDKIDKIIFWAGTTTTVAWLGLLTWLIQKGAD